LLHVGRPRGPEKIVERRDANNDQAARINAAKAAAPYLHPKLAVQEIDRTPAGPVTYVWKDMPMLRRRLRMGQTST